MKLEFQNMEWEFQNMELEFQILGVFFSAVWMELEFEKFEIPTPLCKEWSWLLNTT